VKRFTHGEIFYRHRIVAAGPEVSLNSRSWFGIKPLSIEQSLLERRPKRLPEGL